jgi:hypothetical protein
MAKSASKFDRGRTDQHASEQNEPLLIDDEQGHDDPGSENESDEYGRGEVATGALVNALVGLFEVSEGLVKP